MKIEYKELISSVVNKIQDNQELLNQLDRDIGDGDHGSNILRGVGAVLEDSSNWTSSNISEKLKKTGMILLGKVGGASGVLYGSAFLKMSKYLDKEDLQEKDFLESLKIAKEEIMLKGKSQVGNKTMLDSLDGFIIAFEKSSAEDNNFLSSFKEGVLGAKKGAEDTKDLIAKSGRASYLGERSIGHQDAGATSFYLMMLAISEYLEKGE